MAPFGEPVRRRAACDRSFRRPAPLGTSEDPGGSLTPGLPGPPVSLAAMLRAVPGPPSSGRRDDPPRRRRPDRRRPRGDRGGGPPPRTSFRSPERLAITVPAGRARPVYRLGFRSAVTNVGVGPLIIVRRAAPDTATMTADQLIERDGAARELVARRGTPALRRLPRPPSLAPARLRPLPAAPGRPVAARSRTASPASVSATVTGPRG